MIPFLNPMMMGGRGIKPDGPDIVTDFSPTTLPFTMRAGTSNGTLARQTSGGIYSSHRMRLTITSGTSAALPVAQWTTVPETGESMETLILMQGNISNSVLTYKIYICYKSSSNSGYALAFNSTAAQLVRYTGLSTATVLATLTSSDRPSVLNTWTWFRLRREGRTIKAKWWEDGDPEPESWKMTATDNNAAALAPGGVAIGGVTSANSGINASYYVDWIGVDMEGGRVKPPYEV